MKNPNKKHFLHMILVQSCLSPHGGTPAEGRRSPRGKDLPGQLLLGNSHQLRCLESRRGPRELWFVVLPLHGPRHTQVVYGC